MTDFPQAEQNYLNIVLPVKPGVPPEAVIAFIQQVQDAGTQAIYEVGLAHYFRVLAFDNFTKFGVLAVLDGTVEKYLTDFAFKTGQLFFDPLLTTAVDGELPATPVDANVQGFLDYMLARHHKSIVFFSALPDKSVQDIRFEME
ncbi:MAG: hypothetical protein ACOYL5_01405 [Phototrophicaceae bacterium]|jgi:hypothetical protein